MTEELTGHQARLLFLNAQGFLGAMTREGGVASCLNRVGAVQLDTIAVLARSHELVPYARLGPVGRETVEHTYWKRPVRAFEYWAHAMCILPIEAWPWFAFRRRRLRKNSRGKRPSDARLRKDVLARLTHQGPSTSLQLGSTGRRGPWWGWTPIKMAVEDLLNIGDVACVERQGWRRVYDLAERVIPARLLHREPSDEACIAHLIARAASQLGVATLKDLADCYRVKPETARQGVEGAGLVPVRVRGWRDEAWADPKALAMMRAGSLPRTHRTTLLSPFDSLIWDRTRTERLFGFTHRLEAYVPAAKRTHGYFSMPLLAGGKLVGLADPKREGRTLVAKHVSCEAGAVKAMARALCEAAQWVKCDHIKVQQVTPHQCKASLVHALKRLTA